MLWKGLLYYVVMWDMDVEGMGCAARPGLWRVGIARALRAGRRAGNAGDNLA